MKLSMSSIHYQAVIRNSHFVVGLAHCAVVVQFPVDYVFELFCYLPNGQYKKI